MIAEDSADYAPSAVKVYVRVRPFIDREISLGETEPIVTPYNDSEQSIKVLDPNSGYKPRDVCSFDAAWFSIPEQKSFPFVSQDDIYDMTGEIACENVLAGYNSCIFAYGQTGSGKTYTMMGDIMNASQRGIIPRVCEALLGGCAKSKGALALQCTYYEIYNERVMDLLDGSARDELRVRNDPLLGPYVEGLSIHPIRQERDVMRLLQIGNKERHTALTKMNKQSSRSHAVLTLQLTKRDCRHKVFAKINLVDLAGSERTSVSEVEGTQFKEATKINLSLTTLGRVIDALADQANGNATVMPPYRESLLTWLLSDSLGGNSKTCMIATVSPAAVNFDETLNTLRYASRAREIINICVTNDDPYEKRIKELTMLVEHLRKQLAAQNARTSQGRASTESNAEPIDEKSAKHYQDVISRLHQQVNRLSEDNAQLEKQLQDERSAHEFTIQAKQAEHTTLLKEIKFLRSTPEGEVAALKKGVKGIDLTPLTARRSHQPSAEPSGRSSVSARTSLSRYEMPIRQPRERPLPHSPEYMERLLERYTREVAKAHKEYIAKANEFIEMQSCRITKIVNSRPIPRPAQKPRTSPKRVLALVQVGHASVDPHESKELRETLEAMHTLKDEHAQALEAMSVSHSEAISELQKQLIAAKEAHKASTQSLNTENDKTIASLQACAESERAEMADAHASEIAELKRAHDSALEDMRQAAAREVDGLKAAHKAARDNFATQQVDSMQRVADAHEEAMQLLRADLEVQLKAQVDAGAAELDRVNAEWQEKLESLAQGHASTIAEITESHALVLSSQETSQGQLVLANEAMRKALDAEQEKQRQLASQIEALEKKHAAVLEARSCAYEAELDALAETHKQALAELHARMDEVSTALATAKAEIAMNASTHASAASAVAEEMATLQAQHNATVQAMQAEKTHALEQARAAQSDEVEVTRSKAEREKKNLIDKHSRAIESQKEEFESILENARQEHAKALENTVKEYKEAIDELRSESARAIAVLKEAHAEDTADLHAHYATEMDRVRNDCKTREGASESAHLDAIQQMREAFAAEKATLIEGHKGEFSSLKESAACEAREQAAAFDVKLEEVERAHEKALAAVQQDCDAEIAHMREKHEVAIGSLADEEKATLSNMQAAMDDQRRALEEKCMSDMAQAEADRDALEDRLTKERETALADLESNYDIRLNTLHTASEEALVHCMHVKDCANATLMEKSAASIFAFEKIARDTLQALEASLAESEALTGEKAKLQSDLSSTAGDLEATRTQRDADFATLRSTLSRYDALLRGSYDLIAKWHAKKSRLASEELTAAYAQQLAAERQAHAETIAAIEESNADDRRATLKSHMDALRSADEGFRAIEELHTVEQAARDRIGREAVESLQRIYALEKKALQAQFVRYERIIGALESASEVASDSAKKQQEQIRKLESSIALYKVLQLEGELGMQSGII